MTERKNHMTKEKQNFDNETEATCAKLPPTEVANSGSFEGDSRTDVQSAESGLADSGVISQSGNASRSVSPKIPDLGKLPLLNGQDSEGKSAKNSSERTSKGQVTDYLFNDKSNGDANNGGSGGTSPDGNSKDNTQGVTSAPSLPQAERELNGVKEKEKKKKKKAQNKKKKAEKKKKKAEKIKKAEANKEAEEAKRVAEEAKKVAEEANKEAEEAKKVAEEANKEAEEAKKVAEEANKKVMVPKQNVKKAELDESTQPEQHSSIEVKDNDIQQSQTETPPINNLTPNPNQTLSNLAKSSSLDGFYPVAQKKGIYLEVDMQDYSQSKIELNNRKGSEVDGKRMKNLFRNMKFEYRKLENPTAKQLTEYFKKLSKEKNLSDYGALIILIMAHGQNGLIRASDGKPVYLKDAFNYFNSKSCPGMHGKPKCFFVQACRTSGSYGLQGVPPLEHDFLICYGTTEGNKAYKKKKYGSQFIQTLCDVIEEHGHEEHLLDLLTRTNNELKKKNPKKVLEFMSSLTLKVKL